jgi:hypothetical protein
VTAFCIDAVSADTLTSTGVALTFSSVRLRPSEMLLSLLVADSIAMPLTVALAFNADWLSDSCDAVPVASKFNADRPVAGLPSSVVSVAVILKPLAAPVVVERSDRREPVASVMIDAETPALAALILSRTEDSEVSPAPIVMLTGVDAGWLVNVVVGGVAPSDA